MGTKPVVVVLCALVVSFLVLQSRAQEEPRKPGNASDRELSELMKRKLTSAQKVLEGIAIGDFDKISSQAEELIRISKQAEWKVMKTPQYEMFSNDFRRNAEELVDKAKQKNLDGAALSYVDLTLTCVKCHKYVRESRQSRLDGLGKDAYALGHRR